MFNDWGDPDPNHRYSYLNEPHRQRPYCGECGEPFGPSHDHTNDGRFYCEIGHLHDTALMEPSQQPTHEHAPCPNNPESPNAYPEES